jgi:hypothetical protein
MSGKKEGQQDEKKNKLITKILTDFEPFYSRLDVCMINKRGSSR